MEEATQETVSGFRLIRLRLGRIVVGLTLIATVYVGMTIAIPYLRERRIAMQIEEMHGDLSYEYDGPVWLPDLIQIRRFFNRIHSAKFNGFKSDISDTGMACLVGLKSLEELSLFDTEVTDQGLEGLKGFANLKRISLVASKTTAEGRAMLRKALPTCDIEPNP